MVRVCVFALAVLGTAPLRAEACERTVQFTGPEDIVGELRRAFSSYVLGIAAPEGCPPLQIHVAVAAAGAIVLERADTGTRREVHGREMAVAMVESWLSRAVLSPLLAPGAFETAAPSSQSVRARQTTEVITPARFLLNLTPTFAWSSDNAIWSELSLGGCIRLHRLCVGAAVKGGLDLDLTGPGEAFDTRRLSLDFVFVTDLVLALSGFTLKPGFAVGVGYSNRRVLDEAVPADRVIDTSAGGLRVEARLAATARVSEHLSVVWAMFVDYSPTARPGQSVDSGFVIAGDPRWFLHIGIGLEYAVR